MFDVSKIDIWKVRMSFHLKALGLHVYLAATKESCLGNSKHKKANAQALKALRKSLSKKYLNMVSHCDSAFAVWNTLTSLRYKQRNMWRRNLVKENPNNIATWSKGMTPLRYI